MAEPTAVQKLHANLDYLRKRGASRERVQQEIDRFKQSQDQVSANERKLSGVEKIAGLASKAGAGATFGLLDEATGLLPEALGGGQSGKDTQRFLQKEISEEMPKTAFAAEVAGSLATPGSFLKAAPKAAGLGVKALRALGEGAIQGGLAGVGNAEGSLEDRIRSGAKGATIGSVAAGALGGAGKVVGSVARKGREALGLSTPSLEELIAKVPNEDIAKAKLKLEEYRQRGLTPEVTVADVLPQGEGALRASATANREVRKTVDTNLRERSSRLANLGEERFSQHTGTAPQSLDNRVEQITETARAKAKPHYDAAKQEAAAAPEVERLSMGQRKALLERGVPEDKLPPMDPIDEALSLPYVQQRIAQLKTAPRSRFTKSREDDHELLDQVYKDIGDRIRNLGDKARKSGLSDAEHSLRQDLIGQRAVLAEGITSRSPSYRPALDEFAGEMQLKGAYEHGAEKVPSDVIPSELAELGSDAERKLYKEGKAQSLRRDVPNLDVGEFSRFQDVLAPIATKEKAAVFKATFGDKAYKEYVRDLLGMAQLQRMKGGAGESTTVDKLMEQLQAGGDPHNIAMAIADMVRGNPARAVARAAPLKIIDNLRNSRVAKTNADFLLRRGEPDVSRSLDEIIRMRDAGQRSAGRSYTGRPGQRVTGATARVAGSNAGRG